MYVITAIYVIVTLTNFPTVSFCCIKQALHISHSQSIVRELLTALLILEVWHTRLLLVCKLITPVKLKKTTSTSKMQLLIILAAVLTSSLVAATAQNGEERQH